VEAAGEILRLLEDSVRLQMRSDVPFGAYLSGGLDSSSVVSLLARQGAGKIKTFTLVYEDDFPNKDNDRRFARIVAERCGTEHHEHLVKFDHLPEQLDQVVHAFDEPLRRRMLAAMARTADNTKLQLNIAVNYGGRWDIVQAAQRLAGECAGGALRPEEITEARFAAALSLAGLPEPDLLIRTGGEQRVSNFLLWDLAYAELYFTECLWPDFTVAEFEQALKFFAGRERRFGQTAAQRAS